MSGDFGHSVSNGVSDADLVFEVPPLDLNLKSAEGCGLDDLGLERAWSLARGQGALVGILCGGADVYEPALRASFAAPQRTCEGEDEQLGTFLASVVQSVAPAARLLPVVCFPGLAGEGCSGSRLAAGIRQAVKAGVKVLLFPALSYGLDEELAKACRFAWSRGTFVVAPSGSDSLDQDAFPACLEEVFAVSEWGAGGTAVKAGANLSGRTEILAPSFVLSSLFGGREVSGPLVATAVAAGALGLALSLDGGLSGAELRRLILGGRGVEEDAFYRFHRAVPLDVGRLLRVLRGTSGQVVLRDLWVRPPLARAGESAELWVTVENVGRGRLSGWIEVESPGSGRVELAFKDLRAGESRPLRHVFKVRAAPRAGAYWVRLKGYGALMIQDSWVRFLPRGFVGCDSWKGPAQYDFRVAEGRLDYGSAVIYGLRDMDPVYEVRILNTGLCELSLECLVELDGRLVKSGSLARLKAGDFGLLSFDIPIATDGIVHDVVFVLNHLCSGIRDEWGRLRLRKRKK